MKDIRAQRLANGLVELSPNSDRFRKVFPRLETVQVSRDEAFAVLDCFAILGYTIEMVNEDGSLFQAPAAIAA
jgi:hypothetical protein